MVSQVAGHPFNAHAVHAAGTQHGFRCLCTRHAGVCPLSGIPVKSRRDLDLRPQGEQHGRNDENKIINVKTPKHQVYLLGERAAVRSGGQMVKRLLKALLAQRCVTAEKGVSRHFFSPCPLHRSDADPATLTLHNHAVSADTDNGAGQCAAFI